MSTNTLMANVIGFCVIIVISVAIIAIKQGHLDSIKSSASQEEQIEFEDLEDELEEERLEVEYDGQNEEVGLQKLVMTDTLTGKEYIILVSWEGNIKVIPTEVVYEVTPNR